MVIFEKIPDPRTDFYYRSRLNKFFFVFVEGDTEFEKNFELKKIIDKEISAKKRIKYLIRWKKYNFKYN